MFAGFLPLCWLALFGPLKSVAGQGGIEIETKGRMLERLNGSGLWFVVGWPPLAPLGLFPQTPLPELSIGCI